MAAGAGGDGGWWAAGAGVYCKQGREEADDFAAVAATPAIAALRLPL